MGSTPAQAALLIRCVAGGLEEDYQRTALTLRDAGALVVRAPVRGFGAAAVNTYLHVKARGVAVVRRFGPGN